MLKVTQSTSAAGQSSGDVKTAAGAASAATGAAPVADPTIHDFFQFVKEQFNKNFAAVKSATNAPKTAVASEAKKFDVNEMVFYANLGISTSRQLGGTPYLFDANEGFLPRQTRAHLKQLVVIDPKEHQKFAKFMPILRQATAMLDQMFGENWHEVREKPIFSILNEHTTVMEWIAFEKAAMHFLALVEAVFPVQKYEEAEIIDWQKGLGHLPCSVGSLVDAARTVYRHYDPNDAGIVLDDLLQEWRKHRRASVATEAISPQARSLCIIMERYIFKMLQELQPESYAAMAKRDAPSGWYDATFYQRLVNKTRVVATDNSQDTLLVFWHQGAAMPLSAAVIANTPQPKAAAQSASNSGAGAQQSTGAQVSANAAASDSKAAAGVMPKIADIAAHMAIAKPAAPVKPDAGAQQDAGAQASSNATSGPTKGATS